MPIEDTTGGHACHGPHQLHRIADRMRYRVKIGMSDIAPPGIIAQRCRAGRMEAYRNIQLLQFVHSGSHASSLPDPRPKVSGGW
jgi:hypothetical protein